MTHFSSPFIQKMPAAERGHKLRAFLTLLASFHLFFVGSSVTIKEKGKNWNHNESIKIMLPGQVGGQVQNQSNIKRVKYFFQKYLYGFWVR